VAYGSLQQGSLSTPETSNYCQFYSRLIGSGSQHTHGVWGRQDDSTMNLFNMPSFGENEENFRKKITKKKAYEST
jgi:hypothetical protein